jgi:hypothetical protein
MALPGEIGNYGRAIGRAILASPNKRVSVKSPSVQAHYQDFFPILIRHQVFAYHLGDASVSFESRLSEAYAEAVLAGMPFLFYFVTHLASLHCPASLMFPHPHFAPSIFAHLADTRTGST